MNRIIQALLTYRLQNASVIGEIVYPILSPLFQSHLCVLSDLTLVNGLSTRLCPNITHYSNSP